MSEWSARSRLPAARNAARQDRQVPPLLCAAAAYHKITKGEEGTHYSFDGDGLMVPNPEFQSAQTITEMGWMYFTMWP